MGSVTEELKSGQKGVSCLSCVLRYEGILWSTLSGLSCAVGALLAKHLSDFSSIEQNFHLNTTLAIVSLPLVFFSKIRLNVNIHTVIAWVFCSLFHVVGTVCRYAAFQMMPIGEASAIVFNTPVFTAVMARIFLKEHISRLDLISVMASLVGLSLIIKVPLLLSSQDFSERVGSKQQLMGCGLALISVLGTSGVYISLRRLKDNPPALNTFVTLSRSASLLPGGRDPHISRNGLPTYSFFVYDDGSHKGWLSNFESFISLLICACLTPLNGGLQVLPCSYRTWLLLALSLSSFVSVILNSRALQTEDATTIATTVRSSDMLFAFLFQIFIFSDEVDAYSISGAIVVTISGVLLPLKKWMIGLPDNSKWKVKCLLK